MVKNIGILTFHYAHNFGAVLQAFALFKTCQSLGFDTEIINYFSRSHEKANKIFKDKKRGFIKDLIYFFLVLPYYFKYRRKKKRFDKFISEKLKLTKRYQSYVELITNLPQKCFYITGSDQVFNPVSVENMNVYYLNFPKKNNAKKIAYAPSFGISKFDESISQKIQKLVLDFDSLSCREDDGALFLSSLSGKFVPQVCDPVFLLNKDNWEEFLPATSNKKYIFIYDLNGRRPLLEIAYKIKEIYNLPVYCLTTKKYLFGMYKRVDKLILDAGPIEFLQCIRDAEYVVTDSFHGSAFSIIFHRPFIAYNALPKASQRIISLLQNIGLSKHFLSDANVNTNYIESILPLNEDYTDSLVEFRYSSYKYLQNSLSV